MVTERCANAIAPINVYTSKDLLWHGQCTLDLNFFMHCAYKILRGLEQTYNISDL